MCDLARLLDGTDFTSETELVRLVCSWNPVILKMTIELHNKLTGK